MSLNRQTAKNFFKLLDSYDAQKEMVMKALDPDKPTLVKSHAKNRANLDQTYIELVHAWKDFKRDINSNGDVLNSVEESSGSPNYEHNDAWMETFDEEHFNLIDKSDQLLEAPCDSIPKTTADSHAMEEKVKQDAEVAEKKRLLQIIECGDHMQSYAASIKTSIQRLSNEINSMEDASISVSKVQSYKADLAGLDAKIDGKFYELYSSYVVLLDTTEAKEKKEFMTDFVSTEKAKIDSLVILLNKKIRDSVISSATEPTQRSSEKTFLKKIDPPSFKGDIVEYADFVRKWKAQVSNAGLSADSELDRLRDHIPSQAAKALYGETSMAGAWAVLEKLYGNKDLIASKLKQQLKSIKPKGKKDQDIVIDLVTEVNNIVLRLKTLKMEEMLKVDCDFLSSIYRVLPSTVQEKWLEFDKSLYLSNWDAFIKFLDLSRDKALQSKVLLSSYEDCELMCRKCGLNGHKHKNCPTGVKSHSAKVSTDSSDNSNKSILKSKKQAKLDCGKCPLCNKYHTYIRRKDREEWPTDRLFKCEKFESLSVRERAEALEKYKCCPKCTSWGHKKMDCPSGGKCKKIINGVECLGDHSSMVCGSGSAYCGLLRVSRSYSSSSSSSSGSTFQKLSSSSDSEYESDTSQSSVDSRLSSSSSIVSACSSIMDTSSDDSYTGQFPEIDAVTLLLLQDVNVLNCNSARCCWDNGSNRVLITHNYAESNHLKGQPISFRLDSVGFKGETQDGVIYELTLVQNDGNQRKIWGFGVDSIMDSPDAVNLDSIRGLFPHIPGEIFTTLPKKPVDILIGNNFFQLHPDGGRGINAVGDLKILRSKFGSGFVVAGSHPRLKISSSSMNVASLNIAQINKCEIIPTSMPNFWEADSLGVLPPKRCSRCLGCSNCSDSALIHSRRDQEELDLLKENTKLLDDGLHVNYVFKKNPKCLPNNRSTAVKIAEKQEARLIKSGHLDFYSSEVQKYLDRGGVVRLSKAEIDEWKGPQNYISHHGVEKPSATTPLRVVTNSSLNNAGNSLNGCLIRGPNSLNSMLDIALRFRCFECALVWDLSKAYNALKTGPVERHLRRFIWRFSPSEDWQDFAFDCVAFGDLPAANFLEIGRNLTADAGYTIDAEAAEKIKRDSYVDDNISGGSREAVARMKGNKLGDGSYSGTMTKILKRGNLKPKTFVSSGDTDEEAKELLGKKVLGYGWEATSDVMDVSFPIYVSNKKRKVRMTAPLDANTLKLLPDARLTKRICLGITNGFGDFLGIASPFTIRFKLLMKELFDGKNDKVAWDMDIFEEAKKEWAQLIMEAVEDGNLCFPRSVRPKNAVGLPKITGFADGSFSAFCAAIYVIWETICQHGDDECCQGDFEACLLWAKTKVTPMKGFTVPQSELSAAVLLSRMGLTTTKALNADDSMKPTNCSLLLDSKCTISVIDKSTTALKPFFHNRVSEFHDNLTAMKKICPVDDLHYVASSENPADLATRNGIKLSEIGPQSFWQCGPSFLRFRRDLWPVTRDFVPDTIPIEEIRSRGSYFYNLRVRVLMSSATTAPRLWTAIEGVLNYSNSFEKVRRILARVIRGWKLRAKGQPLSPASIGEPRSEDLITAERLILLSAMPLTAQAFYSDKLVSLQPKKDGQIIVSCGRLGEKSLSRLLGVNALPILMPNSRAAQLYMIRAHEGEHGIVHKSITETLARSRQSVWIVRGRMLAKKVCQNCFICKRLNIKLSGQLMAKVKEESLTVCRPWTYVSLDFAGPLQVKGVVNLRARKKCWIIIYCCRSTKAVCLLSTCGYDTASFLLKHEEFVATHGAPVSIVSDRGTQLVAAGQLLARKQSPEEWSWQDIVSKNSASNWHFVPVGCQHFNGLPESTVKVLKKSLKLALHPGVELNYPELVTLLAKISYTINARPLGLSDVSNSSQQDDIMLPITPNMLLLGRSSDSSPPLDYSPDERFSSRLAYVSEVEKDWWRRWYVQVLPTLFSYKRWKRKQRNLVVGDIVLLHYPNHFKDDYCLGKISDVHPDEEGDVRLVTVQYRKKNPRESLTVCRTRPLITEKMAVHRLHRLDLADEVPHAGSCGD